MTGYADTYVVRVAGIPATWSTAPLVYDPAARPIVSSVPATLRQRLELFTPTGSDSGVEVSLVYGDGVIPLLDRTISPVVDATGAPVRVAVAAGMTTTITTTTPAVVAPGDYITIGGEVVEVVVAVGTAITVIRGALGTVPAPIMAGLVLLAKPATVIGCRVVISRVDYGGTVESVIYRGRIQSLTVDGGNVRLSIGSVWSSLRSRAYVVPTVDAPSSSTVAVERGPSGPVLATAGDDTPLDLDLGPIGETGLSSGYIWLTSGDLAILTEATYAAGGSGRSVIVANGAPVLQVYDGDRMLAIEEVDARIGEPVAVDSAAMADVLAGPLAPSAIVSAILTGVGARRAGLDASEVGDLSPLDSALGVGLFSSPLLSAVGPLVVLPFRESSKLLDVFGGIFEPVGVVILPDSQGRICVIDPVEASLVPIAIKGSDLRSPLLGWSIDESSALRAVEIAAPFEGVDYGIRVVSDVASQLYAGGVELDLEAGLWAPVADSLRIRWRSVVTWLQRGVPVMAAEVERETPLDVGDLVLVDVDTVPNGSGVRGVSSLLCSVLERGEDTRTGSQSVRLLALGHGLDLRLGAWSPTADVVAYAAGVATVGTAYTGTDDAAPFSVGQAVYLLDVNGTRIDTDAPPATIASVGALSLGVVFTTAVPSPTDILGLAQWDEVAIRDVYAWQAGTDGTLGAGADPGFTWG